MAKGAERIRESLVMAFYGRNPTIPAAVSEQGRSLRRTKCQTMRWRAQRCDDSTPSTCGLVRSSSVELNPWEEKHMVAWDRVTRRDVLRAIHEYDRLGPEQFFSEHGFAPTTTYELVWDKRRYPPKAVLGAAYEFATGQQRGSGDFEGGKTGAVRVLGKLGFSIEKKLET
jgi:hypothetical protein